jgi:hypothetical protein
MNRERRWRRYRQTTLRQRPASLAPCKIPPPPPPPTSAPCIQCVCVMLVFIHSRVGALAGSSAQFHNDKNKNMGKVYQACHESGAPRTTATSHTCIAHRSSTPVIPVPPQSHEDHISLRSRNGRITRMECSRISQYEQPATAAWTPWLMGATEDATTSGEARSR